MIIAQPRTRPAPADFGILFAEDFDLPPGHAHAQMPEGPTDEPEIILPAFTSAEVDGARTEAFEEGEQSGLATARAEIAARCATALDGIVAALQDAQAAAEVMARDAAEEIARLLLAGFAALAPQLCTRHGEAEATAVLHSILPALRSEPHIAIRVAPDQAEALRMRLDALDPDLVRRIELVPAPMAAGDVHVSWRDGMAVRDTAAILREIADILKPLGLAELLPPSGPHAEAHNGH